MINKVLNQTLLKNNNKMNKIDIQINHLEINNKACNPLIKKQDNQK